MDLRKNGKSREAHRAPEGVVQPGGGVPEHGGFQDLSRPSPEHKGHKPVKGHMGESWERKRWQCEMQPSFPNEPMAAKARHRGPRDAEGSALWDALSSGPRASAKVRPLSAELKAGHRAHSPQSGGKRSQGQAPWCSREGKEALKDQGQAHAPWIRPLEPCKSRRPSAVALDSPHSRLKAALGLPSGISLILTLSGGSRAFPSA